MGVGAVSIILAGAWIVAGARELSAKRACCERLRALVLAVQGAGCEAGEPPMVRARRLVAEGKIPADDLIDPRSGGEYVLLAEPVDTPHGRAVACSPLSDSPSSWWYPFNSDGGRDCCILYLDGHSQVGVDEECTQLVKAGSGGS